MTRFKLIVAVAVAALGALSARAGAEVKTQELEYKQGATVLQGFVAWDDAVTAKGKRPGVLIVHEWWGHNQHARNQALRLAKAGPQGDTELALLQGGDERRLVDHHLVAARRLEDLGSRLDRVGRGRAAGGRPAAPAERASAGPVHTTRPRRAIAARPGHRLRIGPAADRTYRPGAIRRGPWRAC